jgi:hypothetical protein
MAPRHASVIRHMEERVFTEAQSARSQRALSSLVNPTGVPQTAFHNVGASSLDETHLILVPQTVWDEMQLALLVSQNGTTECIGQCVPTLSGINCASRIGNAVGTCRSTKPAARIKPCHKYRE